jgi:epoxyqueuosine reductase QueG
VEQKIKNYEELKKASMDHGASLFGVADIADKKEHIYIDYPPGILDNLNYAVSLGFHLSDRVLETVVDRPNKIYYRHYKMANIYLDQLAIRVGEFIQRNGYDYMPIPTSQVLDWNGLSAHASHRAIAYHAGLGWRGKSSLLVNPRYGARVRYVSLLTDMPLKTDSPIEKDCGKCRACIDLCPAGAIHEDHYDVDACHEMLKHFGKTLHVSLICGVCVKVCRGIE